MRELTISSKFKILNLKECDQTTLRLINSSKQACEKAYAPYSKYHVGATVLFEDGTTIEGNNQENIAYPSGLCAERVALFYARSKHPNKKIKSITIVAKFGNEYTKDICTPCGACRQVMIDVESRNGNEIEVIMVSQNEIYISPSVNQLMPLSFVKF